MDFTMNISQGKRSEGNSSANYRTETTEKWRPRIPITRTPQSEATLDTPLVTQARSYDDIDQLQVDAIEGHGRRLGRPLSILEAGCGQRWTLNLSAVEYTLTGVDCDPVALEFRKNRTRDLDVAIIGDICTVELPEASFDVVYSCFVLEHVPRADIALQNFVQWLKPGGLLILRLPGLDTARGFLTRALPHGLHVFFYRYILGSKNAGQPGFAPYPTYYHPVIGRERLCRFLGERRVRCLSSYGDGFRRDGTGITQPIVRGVVKLVSILSFERLTAEYSDLLYIAVKEPYGSLCVGR
jgi:SAM-dependent methyltransferase